MAMQTGITCEEWLTGDPLHLEIALEHLISMYERAKG